MTDSNSIYSDLPQGWKWIELENVADILDKYRKPINSTERQNRIDGKPSYQLYPYYGATGQVGYIDDYLLDGDFLLLGEDGAPFFEPFKNVAYLVNGKIWVNNHAHVLKAHGSNKYLCYFLNQVDYHNYVTGTTRLKLNQSSMRKILIKLPPLPEQHRIVEKIEELFSELDNGIASLRKALEQLKTYRQAVLKWAFEGKLTEEWRTEHQDTLEDADTLLQQIKAEREGHYQQQLEDWKQAVKDWELGGKEGKKPTKPQQPKELPPLTKEELSALPQLPDGWVWLNFGDLISEGPQNGLYKPASFYGQGTLIVRIDNFYDGKLNSWKTFKRLRINKDEMNIYRLYEGDILINRVNSMTYIGKCSLVNNLPEECVFESNIMRLRIIPDSCNLQFFIYYLSSVTGLKELRKNAKQAVNQASINQKDVAFSFAPVCSLKEQTQIVQEIESRLSVCDQLEATLTENLDKAEALRQSILKRAFEGKLVPQNPDDEPASELLKSIQQDTPSSPKKTPPKRNPKAQQLELDIN